MLELFANYLVFFEIFGILSLRTGALVMRYVQMAFIPDFV
jgi:hypothetical protein